jgi:hypothetical protein
MIASCKSVRSCIAWLLFLLSVILPANGTTVVPPEFTELVNGSDYIVKAKVKSVTPELQMRNGRERIYTKVELEVLEVIAGTPPAPLVLTMLGGKIGDRELKVQGAPVFYPGTEDILFIQGNGRKLTPLYAMMHGQYPLMTEQKVKGRQYVNRSNLVPLLSTDEIAQPMAQGEVAERLRRLRDPARALSTGDFIKAIKGVRKSNHEHPDYPR